MKPPATTRRKSLFQLLTNHRRKTECDIDLSELPADENFQHYDSMCNKKTGSIVSFTENVPNLCDLEDQRRRSARFFKSFGEADFPTRKSTAKRMSALMRLRRSRQSFAQIQNNSTSSSTTTTTTTIIKLASEEKLKEDDDVVEVVA